MAPAVGWLVTLVAGINVASAVTPAIAARLSFLHAVVPSEVTTMAHELSLSVSALLLAVSIQLLRRRKNACSVAIALLIGLGVLNVVKGLDFEEALLSWTLAVVLWRTRSAFSVDTPPGVVGSAAWRAVVLGVLSVVISWVAVAISSPARHAGLGVRATLREAFALLVGRDGQLLYMDHSRWLPDAIGALGVAVVIATLAPLFRPLRTPIGEPARRTMAKAHIILATHGAGTLGFFTLRNDNEYLFSDDGRAYLAYRVERHVVVVAGDPIGDPASVAGLLAKLAYLAEQRGLRIAVLGAGAGSLPQWSTLGLGTVYLGDEAIVETAAFSLEGRPIRKVRQSVTRLAKAGYTAELCSVADLTPKDLATLAEISQRWRHGKPERGFTMALDRIGGPTQDDCVMVVARDGNGVPRGFLHFAPVYGRPAMSLAAMRRDPDTPNGLMEFLVCESIFGLRERGVRELSLNFATFGRVMREPANRRERVLRRVIGIGDRWFQISSLLRFNEKFFPRWEPRYLLCQGAARVPAAGLAAATVEGQLPRPRLPFAPNGDVVASRIRP